MIGSASALPQLLFLMRFEKRNYLKISNQAQNQGGMWWSTTVIVIYFFATLRPHSFRAGPRFRGLTIIFQRSLSRRSLSEVGRMGLRRGF